MSYVDYELFINERINNVMQEQREKVDGCIQQLDAYTVGVQRVYEELQKLNAVKELVEKKESLTNALSDISEALEFLDSVASILNK